MHAVFVGPHHFHVVSEQGGLGVLVPWHELYLLDVDYFMKLCNFSRTYLPKMCMYLNQQMRGYPANDIIIAKREFSEKCIKVNYSFFGRW